MTWHDWLYKLLAEARLRKPRPKPIPRPPPGAPPAGDPSADRVVEAINRARRKNGIRPELSLHRLLMAPAQGWATHLAFLGRLTHDNADARIKTHFPGARTTGEIIAEGQDGLAPVVDRDGLIIEPGQTAEEQVVRDWMTSPGHRARILDLSYRYAGVGLARGRAGVPFWVVTFAG